MRQDSQHYFKADSQEVNLIITLKSLHCQRNNTQTKKANHKKLHQTS